MEKLESTYQNYNILDIDINKKNMYVKHMGAENGLLESDIKTNTGTRSYPETRDEFVTMAFDIIGKAMPTDETAEYDLAAHPPLEFDLSDILSRLDKVEGGGTQKPKPEITGKGKAVEVSKVIYRILEKLKIDMSKVAATLGDLQTLVDEIAQNAVEHGLIMSDDPNQTSQAIMTISQNQEGDITIVATQDKPVSDSLIDMVKYIKSLKGADRGVAIMNLIEESQEKGIPGGLGFWLAVGLPMDNNGDFVVENIDGKAKFIATLGKLTPEQETEKIANLQK